MKRRVFLAVLVILLSASAERIPAAAQGVPPARSPRTAEDAVRDAERARFAAMVKGDVAALDRLLASELSYTHGDGRLVDKTAFIADLRTGDFKYVNIDAGEPSVRVFGDTAIVTGRAGMHVINKGTPAQIRIAYTNTHVRRNGSWQMVAWHATRLAQ